MPYLIIDFPGGMRVDAHLKNFVIKSDQPVTSGGEGSAPTPIEFFLASIASCAGVYALSFCRNKGIDTKGMKLSMNLEKDSESGLVSKITLDLTLPEGFPEKYRHAIVHSMNFCTVKKHLQNPPEFKITTSENI